MRLHIAPGHDDVYDRAMGRMLVVVIMVAACGGDDAGQLPDAPVPDAPGCPKRWDVTAAGGTAAIGGGSLTLTAPSIPSGIAVQVVQTGLTGDFTATFNVTGFVAGGTGAYLQAVVSADVASPTAFFSAAIGTSPVVGVSAAQQPGTADLQPTTATATMLRFTRTGTSLTATATAGSTTATATGTEAASPLRIGLQLGTNGGAVSAPTTVTITELTLTGTGASADAFDCDSLRP